MQVKIRNICIYAMSIAAVVLFVCVVVYGIYFYNTHSLIKSIENEDIQKVEALLQKGVSPNLPELPPSKLWDAFEFAPKRPLSVACSTGNLEIVELLLNYGATAEVVSGTGFSPLRETLFYLQPNDVNIVLLLLKNGAVVEETYEGNLTFIAAKMVPNIYDKTKKNGTVFVDGYDYETAKDITQIVCLLLGDQNINITNNAGETLLICSTQAENLYLAEYLLFLGADATIVDRTGKTAMDYARESENEMLVSLLSGKA